MKIQKIDKIETNEAAYDVSVDTPNHTYELANGVFVHNSLRVPKQYFGDTDDSAGFNGGTSLSIISSRYAKMIKRIQNSLVQALTDAVNIMLLDKGLDTYVNKFQLHMLPPTTQEEIDRRDSLASKMSIVTDVMNNLNDVEDSALRLRILKSLLSNAISDTEVIDLLQEQIDAIESGDTRVEVTEDDAFSEKEISSPRQDVKFRDSQIDVGEEIPTEEPEEAEEAGNLPTPNDLGVDMTDNQTFSVD